MTKWIATLGDLAGGLGLLVCLVAGVARLAQTWTFAGVQVPAVFQLGTALMVAGCLAKLHVMSGVSKIN